MKRSMSGPFHRALMSGSTDSEDDEQSMKRADERLRRRREWIIKQKQEEEHERLKSMKKWEYEFHYARNRGLPLPKKDQVFPHCTRSNKSRSKSPQNPHRRKSMSSPPKTSILSEKLDDATSVFKGPEGTQINIAQLRGIKVNIRRNIPGGNTTGELRRHIINPEDVLLTRKSGEGGKPIFEREEIKRAINTEVEVEERRTIKVVNQENLERKSEASKRYTVSSRSRSRSPRRTLSRHSREKRRSRDRSPEHKERYRRHSRSSDSDDLRESRRKSHTDHSRSRVREERRSSRDSHHSRSLKDERPSREYRERSREQLRDRNERNRSREHEVPPPHYIQQIPVPVYYENLPPEPIMFGPLVPMPPQVPLGPFPPMMGAMRPYRPRFVPPNMYGRRPPRPRTYRAITATTASMGRSVSQESQNSKQT